MSQCDVFLCVWVGFLQDFYNMSRCNGFPGWSFVVLWLDGGVYYYIPSAFYQWMADRNYLQDWPLFDSYGLVYGVGGSCELPQVRSTNN